MALIRIAGAGAGAKIEAFTVEGHSGTTMGTNFTVGKRYFITSADTGAATPSITGGTVISATNEDVGQLVLHGLYVEATATTITVPNRGIVYPYEVTE